LKCTIDVDIAETGNPNRGYHNYDATIRFSYAGENSSTYVPEKQGRIVDAIVGPAESWMWRKVENPEPGTWKVRYGYDSGD
jgi:hypothetical protein